MDFGHSLCLLFHAIQCLRHRVPAQKPTHTAYCVTASFSHQGSEKNVEEEEQEQKQEKQEQEEEIL